MNSHSIQSCSNIVYLQFAFLRHFMFSSDDNFHCYDTADYTGTITEKVDEGLYDNNAYLPMPLIHHTFKYSRQSEVCALLHLVYNEFCCCCVD